MRKRIPVLIGFLLIMIAVWLQVTSIESINHWVSRLENIAYDIGVRADILSHRSKNYKTPIVIVDIDDRSINAEGRWPWPRSVLAKLTNLLYAQGAVVIVFDMVFPEREQNIAISVFDALNAKKLVTPSLQELFKQITPLFDNDAIFAASLSQGDAVIGMSLLPTTQKLGVIDKPSVELTSGVDKQIDFVTAEGYIGANTVIANAAKNFGFINVFSDDDGIIRRVPIVMRYQNGIYPSLALQAVSVYLFKTIKLVTADYGDTHRLEGVQFGNTIVPVDEQGQVIIPFRGRGRTFPYLSATDVLHDNIPANALTGKIVFVGTTASGLGDLKPTAIQNLFPGIEINATIADGLLKNDFSFEPAWVVGVDIFITFLLGVIFAVVFPYLGPRLLAWAIILLPIIIVYINNWFIFKYKIIISVLIPVLLTITLALFNLIYGYLFEARRREHLKEMFGQYVPEKHIDEMLKSSSSYGLYGEDREMTVLFADIRNFTTISEGMSAEQLKDMLNAFFTPMTEIIFKNKGTIDKYIGDLIMAFWGAPLKDRYHAQHALKSALQMQRKVDEMRAFIAENKWPEINIGIGINTGKMSVGDMGSTFRRNYTVLGDAVNLASRTESLTKFYGVRMMATEHTCRGQTKFLFRLLDRVRVKGKQSSVELYEVVCAKDEATNELSYEISRSDLALAYYFAQKFTDAKLLFEELAQAHPNVKLYSLYLKRIHEFAIHPPQANWDGIYTHHDK